MDARVLVVGLVAAGVAAALGIVLFKPRPFVVGGNSVRPVSVVAVIPPDGRVCFRQVRVPEHTEGLRVVAGPISRPGALRVTVRDTDGAVAARVPLQSFGPTSVHFARALAAGDGVLCLQALGTSVNIGGRTGAVSGDPTVPSPGTTGVLSLWFLPGASDRRSLASQWMTAMDRAAVFRPGWLPSPVLFVALTVLFPLALIAAVATVAHPTRWSLLIVAVVSLVSSASWSLLLVPFDAADEPDHFAYVQSVVERGARPDPSPGSRPTFSAAESQLLDAVRHYPRIGAQEQVPPWSGEAGRALAQEIGQRPPRDNGGGFAESTQVHQPLYYALAGVGYRAAGDDVRGELMGARLVTALIAALIAICAYGIVREIVPREPRLAALAGVLAGLQPVLSLTGGVVNNDTGANAAAAVIAFLTVRMLRRGIDRWTFVGLALALAAAPVLKATALALYPPVLAAVVFTAWRGRRRRATWETLGIGAATLVAAGLAIRAALRSAVSNPPAISDAGVSSGSLLRPLGGKISYAWQTTFPRLPNMEDHFAQTWPLFDIYFVGAWGVFGWFTAASPRWLLYAIGGLAVALVFTGCSAAWRWRRQAVVWGPSVLFLLAVPVVVLVAVSFAYYTPTARVAPAEQGRYLFTAAAPIAALAALTPLAWSKRWSPVFAVSLALVVVGIAVAARLTYTLASYVGS